MKNKNSVKSKSYYVFVGCMTLAVMIMGATYAYFSASATDSNTVAGNTATVTFGLSVEKVTDVDNAFGLIPMYDDRAPFAAESFCKDDLGNPVCQIYKITVKADSPTVMFLDGYITIDAKEGVDVAFTQVELVEKNNDDNIVDESNKGKFKTLDNFDASTMVGTGVRGSSPDTSLNHEEDVNCLFIINDKIGGVTEGDLINIYYAMVWLHDTGTNQDSIQGMQLAYRGTVTFVTAEGNEISATFD